MTTYCTYAEYLTVRRRLSLNSLMIVLQCIYDWAYLQTSTMSTGGSVLDAEGPGFKSQPRRCRILGKLFTPIVSLFTKQRNGSSPLKGCEGNCRPGGK